MKVSLSFVAALALLAGCGPDSRLVDANDIVRVTVNCGHPLGGRLCHAPCDALDGTPVELTLCDDIECVGRTCTARVCQCIGGLVRCGGEIPTNECEPYVFEPQLTIAPALAPFGEVPQGASSERVVFTVENEGTGQSSALRSTLGGSGAASFAIVEDDCAGHRLDPGDTCEVALRFVPIAAGGVSATLIISGGDAEAIATLEGTAEPNDAGPFDASVFDVGPPDADLDAYEAP